MSRYSFIPGSSIPTFVEETRNGSQFVGGALLAETSGATGPVSGTASQTIPAFSQVATGQTTTNVNASATQSVPAFTQTATGQTTQTQQAGLVAYYKCDEGSGTVAHDATGNGHDLTLTNVWAGGSGAPTFTTGKINSGISLTAANQQVAQSASFGAPSSLSKDWSFSVWMNSSTSQQASLIEFNDAVNLGGNDLMLMGVEWSGYVYFTAHMATGGLSGVDGATRTVCDGYWHHIVGTAQHDPVGGTTAVVIYIDGTVEVSGSFPGPLSDPYASTNSYLVLGGDDGGSDFYNGLMDEVGYWNRALSASEVAQLYNGGVGVQPPFALSSGPRNGSATQTVDVFIQTPTGMVLVGVSASQTVPAFTQTATALHAPANGTASQTDPAYTQTATGAVPDNGTSSQSISAFASTATGIVPVKGTESQSISAFTSTATGTVPAVGTTNGAANQTVPAFTSAATGVVKVNGTASQTDPAYTQTTTGAVPDNGASSQSVPAFAQTATGNHNAINGTANQTVPNFAQTATGTSAGGGLTAAQIVADFSTSATGRVIVVGSSTIVIPAFAQIFTVHAPVTPRSFKYLRGKIETNIWLRGRIKPNDTLSGRIKPDTTLTGKVS